MNLCPWLPYNTVSVLLNSTVTSPLEGSGLLITAVSATAGWSINAFSTSDGPIRYLRKYILQRRQDTQPRGLRIRQNKTQAHWSRNKCSPAGINDIVCPRYEVEIPFWILDSPVSQEPKVSTNIGLCLLGIVLEKQKQKATESAKSKTPGPGLLWTVTSFGLPREQLYVAWWTCRKSTDLRFCSQLESSPFISVLPVSHYYSESNLIFNTDVFIGPFIS